MQKQALLQALDIPIWLQRRVVDVGAPPPCPPVPLETLRQCVSAEKTHAKLKVMGKPFSDRAEILFNAMLETISLKKS